MNSTFATTTPNEYGDMKFKCNNGKMTQISMLGFPLEPEVKCVDIQKNHDDHAWKMFMKKGCNFNDGLFKEGIS